MDALRMQTKSKSLIRAPSEQTKTKSPELNEIEGMGADDRILIN